MTSETTERSAGATATTTPSSIAQFSERTRVESGIRGRSYSQHSKPFLLSHYHGRYRVIFFDEIRWVEADSNYMMVHAREGVFPVRSTFREIERKLAPFGFLRARRGVLVAIREVRELDSVRHGTTVAILHGGETIRAGLEFKRRLLGDVSGEAS